MKTFVVLWNHEEKEFSSMLDAIAFAEGTSDRQRVNTYVWTVVDGVKKDEPFFECTWSI